MSDNIFHEVDEEVRRDQLKRLWDRYGIVFIVLAFLVVAGVAGWRGYEYWQARQAAESGARFEAAAALADQGKSDDAQKAFAALAADSGAGYRMLARFREAAELVKGDPKAALAAYDALAADASLGKPFQDLATIRAGLLAADTASLADMQRRLEGVAAPDGTFRHTARELLATTAWRVGDATALKRWTDVIANDAETPGAIRSRVEMLNGLAAPGGKS